MTVETLRNSIQAETNIHPNAQHLYHNGRLISDDSKTMEQLQIGDGEMLALHVRDMRGTTGIPAGSQGQQAGQRRQGGGMDQDPELTRLQILGDPRLQAEARRLQPQLAAALDDPQRFAQLFNETFDRERRERAERQRQIAELNADPFDIEAQAKIEEIIRQERVMENLQNAWEHNPEVFGRVHMLYVDVEVNGYKVKALVDSGAQATIMSPACAEACGIMRLVDKRFAGIARGVGTANIIGRVHSAQIKIGALFLPCSFTVMEGKSVDLLLGLDMLKRHQACIDLAKDKLIIQGVEIPFLGEAEIPKDSEEALEEEPTLTGPGGTTIGQRSGAVSGPGAASADPGPSSSQRQAPVSSTPAPAPNPHNPQRPTFSEEAIDQLVQLGFSREAAINALQATGGNIEYAAGLLFQG
ncbi:Aspartyl protease [Pleurostoma richardsiae]|uniref:DNA damage-inducible protein 1 n=1 Tax=Pleurostoma richardsiae TaxID=41990 RepID=A0AA38RBC7_9PEZI|nr:Aspartyl protease [Pleurostoma richardsiae]